MGDEQRTVVHLLRHGEVHNPAGGIYGRLPGFHLSETGRAMAKSAAAWFDGHDVTALFSSPLERARETAAPLAERAGLEVVLDERLIEPWNHFEGMRFGFGDGSLRHARHWRYLRNPFLPSWGEPYADIAKRMLTAIARAAIEARGHEAVCVSHQLPIEIARRAQQQSRLWHRPDRRRCALASVTSFVFVDERLVDVGYAEPAAHLLNR